MGNCTVAINFNKSATTERGIKMEKWVYVIGDDHVSEFFKTKNEAIKEGLAEYEQGSRKRELSVGIFTPFIPIIDVHSLLEQIQEEVYSDFYDCSGSDTYLEGGTPEQYLELETQLNEVFHSWIEKHGFQANFGQVDKTEVIISEQND